MICTNCDTPLGKKNKSGFCRPCFATKVGNANRKPRGQCLDCGVTLSLGNKSGRCSLHFNQWIANDPEFQRLRAEGIRRKFQEPEHMEKMRRVAIRNARKAAADPEHRAWLVENGRRLYRECLDNPEVRKRNVAAIRANSYKITEHFLGWCPKEYRPLYRRLTVSKRLLAADARAEVEKLIADDEAIRSGNLDDAVHWLTRLAPVKKLDDGTYRYGTAVLSPGELIERAKLKGWQPERLAA